MNLENITARKNRNYGGKRLGRGFGSGKGGHTSSRGQKGQKSRSGHKSTIFFEGGNTPFFRRIPKFRGFRKTDKVEYLAINVDILENAFDDKEVVNLDSLREKGLIRKKTKLVKILGYGDIKKSLTVEGLALSATAKEKIESAKGTIKEL